MGDTGSPSLRVSSGPRPHGTHLLPWVETGWRWEPETLRETSGYTIVQNNDHEGYRTGTCSVTGGPPGQDTGRVTQSTIGRSIHGLTTLTGFYGFYLRSRTNCGLFSTKEEGNLGRPGPGPDFLIPFGKSFVPSLLRLDLPFPQTGTGGPEIGRGPGPTGSRGRGPTSVVTAGSSWTSCISRGF